MVKYKVQQYLMQSRLRRMTTKDGEKMEKKPTARTLSCGIGQVGDGQIWAFQAQRTCTHYKRKNKTVCSAAWGSTSEAMRALLFGDKWAIREYLARNFDARGLGEAM